MANPFAHVTHRLNNVRTQHMATVPPPSEKKKAPQGSIEPEPIIIARARRGFPQHCPDEEEVLRTFRIPAKNTLGAKQVRLPLLMLIQQGYHLFPFHGMSVETLLKAAERLGVNVSTKEHNSTDAFMAETCSTGWSLIGQAPLQEGHVRRHQNGYNYSAAAFADMLAFSIWRMHLGVEPFAINNVNVRYFLLGSKKPIWIRYDQEQRMLFIEDETSTNNWIHALTQQVREVQ